METKIIPSLIAKNQKEVVERIKKIWDLSKDIHLDIMDGFFVMNESLNFDFYLPDRLTFEAHLMVKNPDNWIKKYWHKAEKFFVHIETRKSHKEIIDFLKAKRKKVGLVLNPETGLEKVKSYLDLIDQVLIMTVRPGFYGSQFLPEMLEKVRDLRRLRPELSIGVDGGINSDTIKKARDAGANIFICGSYIINSVNPKEALNNLWQALKS